MISIKALLEQNPDKLLRLSSVAYRDTLNAIAEGAVRCCPSTGQPLQYDLSSAAKSLTGNYSAETLKPIQNKVLKSLQLWGKNSEAYYKRKTAEVKEILAELASTAEFFGKRDQRYTRQFAAISENLETVAQLDDLTRIRASLLHSAGELKGCIERMTREGNDSITQLQESLAGYRAELEQAQELASLDPLTGLYNRREVEMRIGRRVENQVPFCVVIIDLNDFKKINDLHGHLAGDELLRQIAIELRLASRAEDVVGRWGGDEFALVLDGNFTNTKIKVQRMRPWVFGNYELELPGSMLSVKVSASIGMAEWSPGETLLQVLSRADSELYREKALGRAV